MRANLSLLGVEARRSLALWLLPFFAALTGYTAIGELPRGVWLWPHTSVAIQGALVLVGPLAAGLSAWVAARNRRRNIDELLTTTPLSAAVRDLTTWAAATIWICLGYGLAAISLLLLTLLGATWDSPTLGPVLAGLFALCMHSAVGYAIGYYFPRLFTPLLVAILSYLIQGFAGFFLGSYLSPVATPEPDAFYGLFPNISATQTLWFFGACATALGFVALKGRERTAAFWLSLLVMLMLTAGAATVLARTNPPSNMERADSSLPAYEPVCEERGITVCVHPAYVRLLPKIASTVDEVTQPLVGVPGGPTRATQKPDQPASLRADGTLAFFVYDERSVNYQLPVELAYALVQDKEAHEKGRKLTRVQTVVAATLVQSVSNSDLSTLLPGLPDDATSKALDRFSRLSPEKQRTWLEENYGEVRKGQLSLRDLP